MPKNVRNMLLASTALAFLLAGPAHAAAAADATSADAIKSLQKQVEALQKQLSSLQTQTQQQAKAQAETAAKVAAKTEEGAKKEILPGVKTTLGGFFETDAIYRDKNQSADLASSFNTGIPFGNLANAHQSEFRGTARNTRLSLLAEGDVDKDMKIAAFVSGDFLGVGSTSNSVQTNSYLPRLREAYVTIDRNDWGLQTLIGQSFSLMTMNSVGIKPRAEYLAMVIDGSLVPGPNYTRAPQLRVVKSFDEKKINLGLSIESAQINLGGVTAPTAAAGQAGVTVQNAGAVHMTGVTLSTDVAPDVLAKVAYDPGFGHYEVWGVARIFHGNLTASQKNEFSVGGGGGASALLPIIKKQLEFKANVMGGPGLGRYGSVGLADIAFNPNGEIHPLMMGGFQAGLIGHPDPTWDVYTYVGAEVIERHNNAVTPTAGYGSYGLNNTGCNTRGALAATCQAQTESVWQVTPGAWKQIYKGDYGTMKVGAQYSLTRRNAFEDANGNGPHAFENIVMTSFRYFPF